MTPMKWFYSFLKKYWLRMVSGLILVTILAATALASPYISKLIVDDVIKKQNTGLLPKLIILLLAMVVIKFAGCVVYHARQSIPQTIVRRFCVL